MPLIQKYYTPSQVVADLAKDASIIPVKSVDKAYATLGDTLTYTISLQNTGLVPADNVILKDVLPSGVTYIKESLVSSAPYTGSIDTQVTLTNSISSEETVILTFQVLIDNAIPSPNPLLNSAGVSYSYIPKPGLDPIYQNDNSNTVSTQVNIADLSDFTNTTPSKFADIGSDITYVLNFKNTGNVDADNVSIIDIITTDSIISGLKFIPGSIVSSVPFTGTDITEGILLTFPLKPGESVLISFKFKIIATPSTNPIENTAKISYNFTVGPPATPIENTARAIYIFAADPPPSNIVSATATATNASIKFQHGEVIAILSSNNTNTTPGDFITYTVKFNNIGNVDVNDVTLNNVLPPGTMFVPGTVTINGFPYKSLDPNNEINIGTIAQGATTTLTFKTNILANTPNPVTNQGLVYYSYISDPANPPIQNKTSTNVVKISILYAGVNMVKTSDKTGVIVGNIIRYTININNNKNLILDNVIVKDNLQSSLVFNDNLTIDNIPSSQDITTGVNIGSLAVGETKTISFDAKVDSIPADSQLSNSATSTFSYTLNNTNFNGTGQSDVVNVKVYNPQYNITKVPNKTVVKVSDTLAYNITVNNTGDIDINNIILTDTLSNAFEVESIFVNGVSVNGDISKGINIGTVNVSQSSIVILNLKVVASSNGLFKNVVNGTGTVLSDNISNLKSINETNIVNAIGIDSVGVTAYNPSLKLTKSVSSPYAVVGDKLTYTIVATNNGDVAIGSLPSWPIEIFDMLPSSLEFIPESITINGTTNPTLNINQGIDIGTLNVGHSKAITFDVLVLSKDISPIDNFATARYLFPLPGLPIESGSSTSNVVSVIPEVSNLIIIKTANKKVVSLRDKLTYTVTLTNNGTLDATNVIFKDILPSATSLLDHTFKVNGVVLNAVDLSKGVNIGDIPINTTKTIEYTVLVTSSNCSMKLINSASAHFAYTLHNGAFGSTTIEPTETSTTEVDLTITNFKQFSIENNLSIPPQKPYIESINNIEASMQIIDYHVAQTPLSKSLEGQYITGYKLIVNGILKIVVEYTACEETQGVYSAHYDVPFSTFIVLPKSYCLGNKIEVDYEIEDIYNSLYNCRKFFINTTALINVKILSCNL